MEEQKKKKRVVIDYLPHDKQKEAHLLIADKSSFCTVICSGRQAGKTQMLLSQAIMFALEDPFSITWIVSPTESQVLKIYRDINNALSSSTLLKSSKESKGDAQIILHNESKIQFKSAKAESSLRGASVTYLLIDEAAFIKQSTFEYILLPTLNVKGKKLVICSTPRGRSSWFHEWYQKGVETRTKKFSSIKFTSMDNPFCNQEIIELYRLNMSEQMFSQEILGEFVESACIFKNIYELSVLNRLPKPRYADTYFMAVDVAFQGEDYSVLTVLNDKGEMVELERFQNLNLATLADKIRDLALKFNSQVTMIESNNQGQPLIDYLKEKFSFLKVEGFNTNSQSKTMIINNLIAAFANKQIKILKDDVLVDELNDFIFKYSNNGTMQFAAASGGHDDCVMSLAIAWHNLQKNRTTANFDYEFFSF
jgi:PBSX family phage terminase large subunit